MPIPVAGVTGQLDGGIAGMLAKLRGGNLVGGDGIGKGLSRRAVLIRARQPIRASPVGLAAEMMFTALDNRKVLLVTSQWLQTLGEFVAGTLVIDVRKPGFRGYAITDAHEHQSFGRCGCSGRYKTAKANRLKRGQSNKSSRTT